MECCIIPINRSFVRSFVLHIHVRTVLYSYDLLLARANPRPCFNPGMGAGGHGVAVCVCVCIMIDYTYLLAYLGFEISFFLSLIIYFLRILLLPLLDRFLLLFPFLSRPTSTHSWTVIVERMVLRYCRWRNLRCGILD